MQTPKLILTILLMLSLLPNITLSHSSRKTLKPRKHKLPNSKNPPPLLEQIKFSCSTFFGKVEEILRSVQGESEAVTLTDYEVLKSPFFNKFRKPDSLEITGFWDDRLGMLPLPEKGALVLVFVCPNFKAQTWKTLGRFDKWHKRYWTLNRYVSDAGMVMVGVEEEELIRARQICWDLYHGKWYGKEGFKCRTR